MPVPRRTISSARDVKAIDQVLKDRQNPPRPAFTTLYHRRADLTPEAAPPTPRRRSASQQSVQQSGTAMSGSRLSRSNSRQATTAAAATPAPRPHYMTAPRTPVPVSNAAANSNFALLVARDVSRQPNNSEAIRRARLAEQYQLSIDRRYNMVVDEEDIINNSGNAADVNSPLEMEAAAPHSVRRLIRPVSKGGLRSDYYVPNRKHTMSELKQSSAVTRDRVRRLAERSTTLSQQLTTLNIATFVNFIGKASSSLGTVALVNRAFAAAVEAKLLEEDDTATSDEVMRRMRAARAAVSDIPIAFYKAIKSLRTAPPARVMEALLLVMLVVDGTPAQASNMAYDGPAATADFRARVDEEAGGEGAEAFAGYLVDFDPMFLPVETAEAIRKRFPGLDDMPASVAAYNPHAGALVEWVCNVLYFAAPN